MFGYLGRERFMWSVSADYPIGSDGYVLIKNAYLLAEEAFKNVERESGEKYIRHLESTGIGAHLLQKRLGLLDAAVVAIGLLHDLIELSTEWTEECLVARLGEPGSLIWTDVSWISKRPVAEFDGSKARRDAAFNLQLLRAPLRPGLVKIADTTDNLLTLWPKPLERQYAKVYFAKTTCRKLALKFDVFAPELEFAIWMAELQFSGRKWLSDARDVLFPRSL